MGKSIRRWFRRRATEVLVVIVAVWASSAGAQTPVRFVVAFAPGGIADTVARLIGAKVAEQIGRPVIVENRGGAGGNLATRAVATSPPDGSVFLVHTAGKLKGVAVMSAKRSSALPDVPTTLEAGIPLEASGWVGVLAPPGTKPDVAARMNEQIGQGLRQRDVRERLENIGFEPMPGSAEAFAAYLRKEVENWANIVRTAGIKQD